MEQLIPHLFRTESRKIVAVLSKYFGSDNLQLAEDIASEAFLQALETWPYRGVPENPTGWLYTVAKNKARNQLHRVKIFEQNVAENVKKESGPISFEIDLSEKNIFDSQLQMLFAICHPAVPPESQIALALRALCGFGIEEIANAFLTSKETINKRLFRAKEKIRTEKIEIAFPPARQIQSRLEAVLRTLYLLFNEGYYSETSDSVLRKDLCVEATRLTSMLADNPETSRPGVHALLALMCFHSSRFAARKNDRGELILFDDQDESLWDQSLIAKGAQYLNQSARGDAASKYHFEAAIAYWHTVKSDTVGKWKNILQLYDHLLKIEYSPVAALNRAYALSKVIGKEEAIREVESLHLKDNAYYYALLGHLYKDTDEKIATENWQRALSLARTKPEREIIRKKIGGD